MREKAESFRLELLEGMTYAEKRFKQACDYLGLKLECQFIVYLYKGRLIDKFYIADFCDPINKIIIEVDGKYHYTQKQKIKDKDRDYDLSRLGYKVFRISNTQIYNGKVLPFLFKVYKNIL